MCYFQETCFNGLDVKLFEKCDNFMVLQVFIHPLLLKQSELCLFLRSWQPYEPIAKDEEEVDWFNIHLTHITPHP